MINSQSFYQNYHGHNINDLTTLVNSFRSQDIPIIYLAGDSSLDNKYWLNPTNLPVAAPKQYQHLLSPPFSVQDVTYWLNTLQANYAAVDTAVEESTLADRAETLLPQDIFIRDTITENDVIIVSIGGNDIALNPSIYTVLNMILLLITPKWMIMNGYAPGLQYFIKLFGRDIASYINKLTSKCKPKHILVCMIYYPDLNCIDSWANRTLSLLGYDTDPSKLQLIIQHVYQQATRKLFTTPIPLFEVLNCYDSNDYVQRVEPSVKGGRKIAEYFLNTLNIPIFVSNFG